MSVCVYRAPIKRGFIFWVRAPRSWPAHSAGHRESFSFHNCRLPFHHGGPFLSVIASRRRSNPGNKRCATRASEWRADCRCIFVVIGHSGRDTFWIASGRALAMTPRASRPLSVPSLRFLCHGAPAFGSLRAFPLPSWRVLPFRHCEPQAKQSRKSQQQGFPTIPPDP